MFAIRVLLADMAHERARGVIVQHDPMPGVGHEDRIAVPGDARQDRLFAQGLPGGDHFALSIENLDVVLHTDVDRAVIRDVRHCGSPVSSIVLSRVPGRAEHADRLVARDVDPAGRIEGNRPRLD